MDAIADKCWEIGQGRFGARAVRAILENHIVTEEQQVSKSFSLLFVCSVVLQNCLLSFL